MVRTEENVSSSCPDCKVEEHTVHHLFECSSTPTELTIEDLCRKPKKVAEFLNLATEDSTQTTPSEISVERSSTETLHETTAESRQIRSLPQFSANKN